jgi:hypothetical protein
VVQVAIQDKAVVVVLEVIAVRMVQKPLVVVHQLKQCKLLPLLLMLLQ